MSFEIGVFWDTILVSSIPGYILGCLLPSPYISTMLHALRISQVPGPQKHVQ